MFSYLFEPRSRPDYDDGDIADELWRPSDLLWLPAIVLAPFGFMLLAVALPILLLVELAQDNK